MSKSETDKQKRHSAIAEVVAATTILSMVLYVGLVVVGFLGASFAAVGGFALGIYSFLLLMSATKLYGKGVLKAAKDAGGQLMKNQRR
jgi:small neutral amino acid transporter SnatA (MarC family)